MAIEYLPVLLATLQTVWNRHPAFFRGCPEKIDADIDAAFLYDEQVSRLVSLLKEDFACLKRLFLQPGHQVSVYEYAGLLYTAEQLNPGGKTFILKR